jgi:hypothetical protein
MHKVNAQTFKLALFGDYLTLDAHVFGIEGGDYMRFSHPAFSHASPPFPIYRLVQLLHNAAEPYEVSEAKPGFLALLR